MMTTENLTAALLADIITILLFYIIMKIDNTCIRALCD